MVSTYIPDKGISVIVAAAGVCHSDLHVLEGGGDPPPEGFILGYEVSGWVVEFGPRCENPHGLSPGIPSCLG
jgi:D-arabinose 1-dehydrogenase-like Zn-dependent alcohol dehydrogenase